MRFEVFSKRSLRINSNTHLGRYCSGCADISLWPIFLAWPQTCHLIPSTSSGLSCKLSPLSSICVYCWCRKEAIHLRPSLSDRPRCKGGSGLFSICKTPCNIYHQGQGNAFFFFPTVQTHFLISPCLYYWVICPSSSLFPPLQLPTDTHQRNHLGSVTPLVLLRANPALLPVCLPHLVLYLLVAMLLSPVGNLTEAIWANEPI